VLKFAVQYQMKHFVNSATKFHVLSILSRVLQHRAERLNQRKQVLNPFEILDDWQLRGSVCLPQKVCQQFKLNHLAIFRRKKGIPAEQADNN